MTISLIPNSRAITLYDTEKNQNIIIIQKKLVYGLCTYTNSKILQGLDPLAFQGA